MLRCPPLPLLPGNTFTLNVGQTKFHKPHHLDFVAKGVPYVTDRPKPGVGGTPSPYEKPSYFPAVFNKGESVEYPSWIVFDKQVLCFDAFYKESISEQSGYNFIVHFCKIYFFLEDGTIKVVEPKIRNSGIPQGCLLRRQKIRLSATSRCDDCYDILDLNIGREVDFYGKLFKIINCDEFTRIFLNRLGIAVPDPIPRPNDPYTLLRKQEEIPRKSKGLFKKENTFSKFLALEGRILSFDAYWDDRKTEGGYLHLIKVYYYLCDDTMEMKDVTESDSPVPLIKRCKLPKEFNGLPSGRDNEGTLLNIIGNRVEESYSILDPLNLGRPNIENFTDRDLVIGAIVNAYGRKIMLIDCDNFTKQYYRVKYGLDDFTPVKRPLTREEEEMAATKTLNIELPPYNGFGTHEDSAINCRSVNPFLAVKSYKQFYEKDKEGYDSRILRFGARLLSKNPDDKNRAFTIAYFLVDDTISVFEPPGRNTGLRGGTMMGRRRIIKPGQNLYGSKVPEFYTQQDLFVGNIVILESFKFEITDADEYTFKYMELRPNEFHKSNVGFILDKIREAVRPTYKNFVAQYLVNGTLMAVPYHKFRTSLKQILGEKITEHEILTLARHFLFDMDTDQFSLETLRRYTHDELRRQIFSEFDRLKETFLHCDNNKTGLIPQSTAYHILRGARIPLDPDLIKLITQKFAKGQESCEVPFNDLVKFLDYKKYPSIPIEPISIPANMSWIRMNKQDNKTVQCVDIQKLVNELHLEEELLQQSQ